MPDRPAPTSPASTSPASVHRFTQLARLWMIGLIVAVGALELVGWFAVGLAVLAAGIIGFTVVFDGTRSWWPPEVRAYHRGRRIPGGAGASGFLRTPLTLAAILISVTAVVVALVLLAQPR